MLNFSQWKTATIQNISDKLELISGECFFYGPI